MMSPISCTNPAEFPSVGSLRITSDGSKLNKEARVTLFY